MDFETPNVVQVSDHLYVKNEESLLPLIKELEGLGYEVKESVHQDFRELTSNDEGYRERRSQLEKIPTSLWYARFREDVLQRKGICRHCGALIDTAGIASHKHVCTNCGGYTYLDVVDGSIIRFAFAKKEEHRGTITMKAKEFDEETKSLIFYPKLINSNRSYLSLNLEQAREYFERNKDSWSFVERLVTEKRCILKKRKRLTSRLKKKIKKNPDRYLREVTRKRRFVAIKQNIRSGCVETINICDTQGSQSFYKIVKIFRGKMYDEWDRIPESESFHLVEAWRWAPLKKSADLHEQILHAAGCVSRCDYYYQDGRQAIFDVHLERMRTFVEHFTEIPIQEFDRFLLRCNKSGPGFIRALANFVAGKNATVRDEPNVINLINGFHRAVNGYELTTDEIASMKKSISDRKTLNEFRSIFEI